MRAVCKYGVLLLLLISWLAPAMACIVPDAQLSQEERACCRMMKAECGQMQMPASHDCCQKDVQAFHRNALKTRSVDVPLYLVSIPRPLVVDLWLPGRTLTGWIDGSEFSLPHSPPSSISVLRI